MTTSSTCETEAPDWRRLHNRHTGERLHLRRVVRDGQLCLQFRSSLPPGRQGPPLHVHYRETEEGTVIGGTLGAEVDGRRIQVETGGRVILPMGSAHRWWNAGEQTLVMEAVSRPVVDLDVFLEAVFDVSNSGSANRPPLLYMAHLVWRHRKTQGALFMPWVFRTVLVPVMVLAGTILGRYRGTDWPGCPDRCSAAPLVSEHEASADQPRP